MSVAQSVAHNTFVQIAGKAASTVLGLAAVAIITRSLGLEQFGWYVTATGFLQFVGILSDFGFTVTTSNLLAEPDFDKKAVLATVFSWRLVSACFFQGLAPLAMLLFPYPAPVKAATAILTISFFTLALNQVFIGYYRERLQARVVAMAEIIGRLCLVVGVALVALGRLGFLPTMVVITLAAVVSTVCLAKPIGRLKLNFNPIISRALFGKLWPTALAVICNALYLQGDRVILPLFVPQTAVGLYGASYRVLDILIQIAAMVMGVVMPLLTFAWSRGRREEFRARCQLGFDLLSLLLFPMTVGLWALATPIMRLVAGENFAAAGPILRWLALSIFGTCWGMVFGHVLLAINRQRQALWVYASDAVISLIGYFVFIPRFGLWGAVGVTIFSEVYAGALLASLSVRYGGVYPRLVTAAKICLASLLMGAALYAVPLPHPLWSILWGAAVYGILVIIFKIIPLRALRQLFSAPPTIAQSTLV